MSVVAAEAPERPSTEAKRALLARLAARFGNRFSAGTALREQHANTLTWIACQPPDAVVFAETTQEVVEVVRLCAEARVPIIPFGSPAPRSKDRSTRPSVGFRSTSLI